MARERSGTLIAAFFGLLCLLTLAPASKAQGVMIPPQIALQTVSGITKPLPSATVTVCAASAIGLPCSPALSNALFKDAALTEPLSNPFTADASGNYVFAIAPGNYTVTVTATNFAGYSYQISATCPSGGPCTFTNLTASGLITASGGLSVAGGSFSSTVPGTHSGAETFTGPLLAQAGPICDVKAWGAVGDFSNDDTAAINSAISACAGLKGITYFPPGTYRFIPATNFSGANGFTIKGAFPLVNNMHILGSKGAVLKLANNVSTDGAPLFLAAFYANTAVNNITFDCQGMQFDMNGANNTLSPNRPTTYNNWSQATIDVEGVNGHADDVLITGCQFLNTAGVNSIVAGAENTPGITLGKRWTVSHNLFLNNGTDTNDYTAFYGWSEDVDFHDNLCRNDTPVGTVGKTGGYSCFEVHGARSDYHDNRVYNFYRGGFFSNNYTSAVVDSAVHDNIFNTKFEGLFIVSANAASAGFAHNKAYNNSCSFDDYTMTGASTKICMKVNSDTAMSDIQIENNRGFKAGASTTSTMVLIQPTTAGAVISDVRVNDNKAYGFTVGIQARNDNVVAALGAMEFSHNEFSAFADAGGTTGTGISVISTNNLSTLVIDGNKFIDEQGVPTFKIGINLNGGTITDLYVGPQTYKGLTQFAYNEGAITITNRKPIQLVGGASVCWMVTVGGVLTCDTGISREAANIVDIGNGTQGDKSGTLKAAVVTLPNGNAPAVIASGTATMTTALIGAGACGTTVTVSATNTTTTDTIQHSFNAAVGANPGVLIVHSWPTANNVNFVYCNPTAAGVTPSAATLNWRVVR